GIEARVAFGARRPQQPLALGEAQRLPVDVVLLRDDADHEIGLAGFLHVSSWRTSAFLIRPNARRSAFDRSSRSGGSTSRTAMTRSPRRPSREDGAPRS